MHKINKINDFKGLVKLPNNTNVLLGKCVIRFLMMLKTSGKKFQHNPTVMLKLWSKILGLKQGDKIAANMSANLIYLHSGSSISFSCHFHMFLRYA